MELAESTWGGSGRVASRETMVRRDGKETRQNSGKAPRGQHSQAHTGLQDRPEVVTGGWVCGMPAIS